MDVKNPALSIISKLKSSPSLWANQKSQVHTSKNGMVALDNDERPTNYLWLLK